MYVYVCIIPAHASSHIDKHHRSMTSYMTLHNPIRIQIQSNTYNLTIKINYDHHDAVHLCLHQQKPNTPSKPWRPRVFHNLFVVFQELQGQHAMINPCTARCGPGWSLNFAVMQ